MSNIEEEPRSRGLNVTIPSLPGETDTSRGATAAKLARHVAALFGVGVPGAQQEDAPWLSDYNELSNVDIGKGSPPGWDPLDGKMIASATLSKFGPEVKASTVLTGVNKLLESTMDTMAEVLQVTRLSEDHSPLADASRISIWASLQLDAFVAQPLLMDAAYKARAIQRAVTTRWRPLVDSPPATPRDGKVKRSVEFNVSHRPRPEVGRAKGAALGVVDTLMREVVDPVAVTPGDGEMSNRLLVEETINRMLSHLTDGLADAGFARITSAGDDRRRIDVVVNRSGLLSAFLDANLRVYSHVQPVNLNSQANAKTSAPVPFDAAEVAHWRRLMPRVPSQFELLRSPPQVQRATIRAIADLLRALRSTSMEMPQDVVLECIERTYQLSSLADSLLGPNDEESLIARARHQELLLNSYRKGDIRDLGLYADLTHLTTSIIGTCEEIFARSASYPAGEWITVVDQVSTAVTMAVVNMPTAGHEVANRAADAQQQAWRSAFQRLGIDLDEQNLTALKQRCEGLATALHDWMAPATRRGRPLQERIRAVDIGLQVVLPLRGELAQVRRHDRPLRFTLQVLGRAISALLDEELSPDLRHQYEQHLLDVERQLSETARIQYLLTTELEPSGDHGLAGELVASDVLALLAFADIAVRNVEVSWKEEGVEKLKRAVRMARMALTSEEGSLPEGDLAERLQQIERRWEQTRQVEVKA